MNKNLFVRRRVVVVINARHFPSHTKIVRGDRCSNDTEKPRNGKIRVFSDLRDPIRGSAMKEKRPEPQRQIGQPPATWSAATPTGLAG